MQTQTNDETEDFRRGLAKVINMAPAEREILEECHGQVWDTEQLRQDFEVIGFAAPMVVVKRRSDGVKGSLFFQHNPRFYFNWEEDKP